MPFLGCSATAVRPTPPQPVLAEQESESTGAGEWLEGLDLSFTNPDDLVTYTATGPYELRTVTPDRIDMVGFDPTNRTPVPVTLWIGEQSLWAQAWFGTHEFLTRVR